MKKILVAMLVFFLLMPAIAKAEEYAGVGLACFTYGETVAKVKDITVMDVIREWFDKDAEIEGNPVCINYGVYNPFDIPLETRLIFRGDIKDLVFDVEPETVLVTPEENKLPEQAIPIKVCFKVKTKYPYTPKIYKGSTSAEWSLKSSRPGTGSATGGSVECPFTLQVNTKKGQEIMLEQRKQAIFKLQVLITVIIVAIALTIVLALYRRKKKKEWESKIVNVCPNCKKRYPLELKHCPNCGAKLKKYKAGKEVD